MSLADDLQHLARLHADGRLSDAEYATAKARLLAQPTVGAQLNAGLKRLRRDRDDRWLGGVCGGLAQATDTPAWVWRLGFLLLLVCGGTGVLLYALAWLLVPLAEPRPAALPHGAA